MRKIYGQIGRLKKECIEHYKELHAAAWPGVLETIHACKLQNYSIFLQDDLVFGYYEYTGDDYEADMAKMAADPITQQWWKQTRPCFTKYNDLSREPFYQDMEQIFFFE